MSARVVSTRLVTARAALLAALALAACGGGEDPIAGPGGGNVSLDEFPRAGAGGDPRGSYTPNEPLVAFFNLPTGISIELTRNRGAGTITVSGASAESGTITATGVTLDVVGTVRTPLGAIPLDAEDFSPLTEGSGTVAWRAIAGNRLVVTSSQDPAPDTLEYARTARGLFLIQREDVVPGLPPLAAVIALRSR